MIDDIKRVAGPYRTAGQTQLPFSFAIFELTDVYVATATSDLEVASHLVYGSDYTVTMNSDQSTAPGGTVTLSVPIVDGQVVVVGSAIPYNQTTQLTNFSRFPPEIINTALDRIVVQIQQIVEGLDRTLSVPVTSSMTPDEMITMLLTAQNDASQYAEAAAVSAKEAKDIEERLTDQETSLADELAQVGEDQIAAIRQEGTTQKGIVTAEGDAQVERIKGEASQILWEEGIACQEETWTLSQAVPAGTELTIPNGLKYMVGRHHLRLSWNGLALYPGENYSEVGDADTKSQKIVVYFPMEEGDEINAWVASLGAGAVADAIATANAASDAVAELSQKVVYKSAESAS